MLINPWSVVSLPAHASFPFRAHAVCVYAQLTGGLGRFELALEMRQQRDDGSTRAVGSSKVQQFDFNEANRLLAAEISFRLQQVPFREAGLYELRILASDGANNWFALPGATCELRVLDARTGI